MGILTTRALRLYRKIIKSFAVLLFTFSPCHLESAIVPASGLSVTLANNDVSSLFDSVRSREYRVASSGKGTLQFSATTTQDGLIAVAITDDAAQNGYWISIDKNKAFFSGKTPLYTSPTIINNTIVYSPQFAAKNNVGAGAKIASRELMVPGSPASYWMKIEGGKLSAGFGTITGQNAFLEVTDPLPPPTGLIRVGFGSVSNISTTYNDITIDGIKATSSSAPPQKDALPPAEPGTYIWDTSNGGAQAAYTRAASSSYLLPEQGRGRIQFSARGSIDIAATLYGAGANALQYRIVIGAENNTKIKIFKSLSGADWQLVQEKDFSTAQEKPIYFGLPSPLKAAQYMIYYVQYDLGKISVGRVLSGGRLDEKCAVQAEASLVTRVMLEGGTVPVHYRNVALVKLDPLPAPPAKKLPAAEAGTYIWDTSNGGVQAAYDRASKAAVALPEFSRGRVQFSARGTTDMGILLYGTSPASYRFLVGAEGNKKVQFFKRIKANAPWQLVDEKITDAPPLLFGVPNSPDVAKYASYYVQLDQGQFSFGTVADGKMQEVMKVNDETAKDIKNVMFEGAANPLHYKDITVFQLPPIKTPSSDSSSSSTTSTSPQKEPSSPSSSPSSPPPSSLPADPGSYMWNPADGGVLAAYKRAGQAALTLPETGKGRVRFVARGTTDMGILLFGADQNGIQFRVVIGSENNTKIKFFKKMPNQPNWLLLKEQLFLSDAPIYGGAPNPAEKAQYMNYYVQIDSNRLAFGRIINGILEERAVFQDADLYQMFGIIFEGGSAPVQYKNFVVERSTTEEVSSSSILTNDLPVPEVGTYIWDTTDGNYPAAYQRSLQSAVTLPEVGSGRVRFTARGTTDIEVIMISSDPAGVQYRFVIGAEYNTKIKILRRQASKDWVLLKEQLYVTDPPIYYGAPTTPNNARYNVYYVEIYKGKLATGRINADGKVEERLAVQTTDETSMVTAALFVGQTAKIHFRDMMAEKISASSTASSVSDTKGTLLQTTTTTTSAASTNTSSGSSDASSSKSDSAVVASSSEKTQTPAQVLRWTPGADSIVWDPTNPQRWQQAAETAMARSFFFPEPARGMVAFEARGLGELSALLVCGLTLDPEGKVKPGFGGQYLIRMGGSTNTIISVGRATKEDTTAKEVKWKGLDQRQLNEGFMKDGLPFGQAKMFGTYWFSFEDGIFRVGKGAPGEGEIYNFQDKKPLPYVTTFYLGGAANQMLEYKNVAVLPTRIADGSVVWNPFSKSEKKVISLEDESKVFMTFDARARNSVIINMFEKNSAAGYQLEVGGDKNKTIKLSQNLNSDVRNMAWTPLEQVGRNEGFLVDGYPELGRKFGSYWLQIFQSELTFGLGKEAGKNVLFKSVKINPSVKISTIELAGSDTLVEYRNVEQKEANFTLDSSSNPLSSSQIKGFYSSRLFEFSVNNNYLKAKALNKSLQEALEKAKVISQGGETLTFEQAKSIIDRATSFQKRLGTLEMSTPSFDDLEKQIANARYYYGIDEKQGSALSGFTRASVVFLQTVLIALENISIVPVKRVLESKDYLNNPALLTSFARIIVQRAADQNFDPSECANLQQNINALQAIALNSPDSLKTKAVQDLVRKVYELAEILSMRLEIAAAQKGASASEGLVKSSS